MQASGDIGMRQIVLDKRQKGVRKPSGIPCFQSVGMDPKVPHRRCDCFAVMNSRQRGSETVEFTLVLLTLMAAISVLFDAGWAIFAKSTLQRAVRVGVTSGSTLTASQISSGCLTDNVKTIVQQNSWGLLAGSSGLNQIKVNYFSPPAPNSADPLTDVSSQSDGNSPGNLIQVSVQNFSLIPLMPRIVDWNTKPDNSAIVMSAYSAGLIEPSKDLPCIGTAP